MADKVVLSEMCKNCKFVQEHTGSYTGSMTCHRYPPTIHPDNAQMNCSAKFPLVDANQWCGEFKQKEQK